MNLPDIPTLILAESLTLLQLAALVYVTGRRMQGVMNGPRAWSMSLLAYALAQFCLSLEWKGLSQLGLATDLLAAAGAAGFVLGLDDFANRPRNWRAVGTLLGCNLLALILVQLFMPGDYARPLVFGVVQFAFGYLLLQAIKMPLRPQQLLGVRLLSVLAWAWCGVNAYRLIYRLVFAPQDGQFQMFELLFYVLVLFFGIWLALVCLVMIHERIATELSYATRMDPLTMAFNRRGFADALQNENRRLMRTWVPVSLLAIDLDHFKALNDQHGHPAGDEVLMRFATMVREELRDVDVFARLGGEEFAIVLLNAPMDGATIVAERLRMRAETMMLSSAVGPIRYTISIGVASLSPQDCELEPLLVEADRALYVAKQAGRNRVIRADQLSPAA